MKIKSLWAALAGASILLAAPLHAETLPVSTMAPANTDDAIGIDVIMIDDFEGSAGPDLKYALMDRLAAVNVEQGPFFKIVPSDKAGSGSPGIRRGTLFGVAQVDVDEIELDPRIEKTCIEEKKDECVRYRTTEVACYAIVVSLNANVRMVAELGREERYSNGGERARRLEYCAGDDRPTVGEVGQSLLDGFAREVRMDFAPRMGSEQVRLLEKRKGLSKEDRATFKRALSLTKHDQIGACVLFDQLSQNNFDHQSVRFNSAVCRESEGDLRRALSDQKFIEGRHGGHSYVRTAIARLQATLAAQDQVGKHFPPDYILDEIWGVSEDDAGETTSLP
ncbi:hypothetical protein GRI34_06285 [Erythrobacter aquimaris]|uniref:Uncharacterized protein n=1 Tax=Qipengyuania aquimaris TaxID=255984 RepID=A0A6I4TLA1_9SPHN|nr:hypothetical protein [Qipengyuania aquimaris]MXO96029.1 hypothetical protein [Qipengyuania aquimaris]